MSEDVVVSDQNGEVSDESVDRSNSGQGSVAIETHRKLLAQYKRDKEKLEQVTARLEQEELNRQKAEGNKDQVIQAHEKKIGELEQKIYGTVKTFTERTIKDAVATGALSKGIQPDKLPKFLKLTQDAFLKNTEIQVDYEEFKIANEDVFNSVLEEQVKDNLDWFTRSVEQVRDVTPSSKSITTPTKSIKEMSVDELANLL